MFISPQSSSSQSLPAAYLPPPSVTVTVEPHPQHSSTAHKSFRSSSEVAPLANSTLLNHSPPSLSGSTSSLSSVKSTKSVHEFTSFSKPSGDYSYSRGKTWSKRTGLASTPKPNPFTTMLPDSVTTPAFKTHLSTSSYPSLSSYSSLTKQLSMASTVPGSFRRPGSASSSHGSLTNRGKQSLSGVVEVTGSALNSTVNGHRSAMSYLSLGEKGSRELCVNGGSDGASTGSDSLSPGRGGNEMRRRLKSPLSPDMELERARSKIRVLEKEV